VIRRARALAALASALAATGCYQARLPPQIGEAVRVEVVSDRGRYEQAQAELHESLASTLTDRLGWRVSPGGSARLMVAISQEQVGVTLRDARGLPVQWSIRLNGSALLVCQKGSLAERFTGVAYATSLNDEDQALASAASNAAFSLSCWLETETKTLR
jgi:hypothetical protein